MTLLASAVLLVLASNLVDIVRVHGELAASRDQMDAAAAGSAKAEAQASALASATAALARQGNANAAAVMTVLQRNGVRVADPGRDGR